MVRIPLWHRVSFSLVGQKHVKYLRRYVRVHEVDELAFPHIVPHCKPVVFIHPYFYCMLRAAKFIARKLHRYGALIGIDVADSDHISNLAVSMTNYAYAMVVPSTFCKRVFEQSGVTVPIYVVPHGLEPEWYEKPSLAGRHFHDLLKLKQEKKLKFILFFLWHCYDEKTRVLTKEGFKYWWELRPDDEIATVNLKTGELEYQKPEEIIVADYEGEMIHFEGEHYDLLVTPNHRMVVRLSRSYVTPRKRGETVNDVIDPLRPWEIKYAEDLARNNEHRRWELMRAVRWRGRKLDYVELPDVELDPNYPVWVLERVPNKPRVVKRVPIRPLLRFLGWFIAEGNARYSEHNQEYMIFIWNKRKEYLDEIAQTIREMGFNPVVNYEEGYVVVASKQLYMFLKSLGLPLHPEVKGRKARMKFVPQFIKELDPELIKEFIDALWKGDGSFYTTKDGRKVYSKYSTSSRRLAEDVAELMLKLGYAVAISYDEKRNEYHVVVSERYRFPSISKPPKIVHYRGKIWCVKVPNGTLIVERNGKIVVSGNSGFRKGVDLVIEWYKRLKRERRDVVIILKTGIPDAVEARILAPFGCIHIHGWLTEEQKMELFDLADLYPLFSRGGGFELNGLEAIARGVPVIAPRGGSWEDYLPSWSLVDSRRCPYVLKDNPLHDGGGVEIDIERAVDRAHIILDNLDDYRARVREHVEKHVRDRFRWDVIGKMLWNIVLEVKSRLRLP